VLNDAGDFESLAALFTDDAVFVRPSAPDRPVRGRAAILEQFLSRPARNARHLLCNTLITWRGEAVAQVRSYSVLIVAQPQGGALVSVGAFDDEVVKVGTSWLFRERRGSTAIDGLALGAVPTG